MFSIRKKVFLAFIIGCTAIALSWIIVRIAFKEVLGTVQAISEPNEKLRLVNSIFQTVSRLDQAQRTQAIENPNQPYESFLDESQSLLTMIDTLRAYSRENPEQMLRLDSMESILHRKDNLFIKYLKMRADLIYNKTLSKRINDLSGYISAVGGQTDSSVVTTERKTTTTTIIPSTETDKKQEQESFFKRLFGKKKTKKEESTPQQLVTEDLNIRVDTLAVAQRDSVIKEIEAMMQGIEKDQHYKGLKLLTRETELNASSNLLINQLITLIRKIEAEEIEAMKENNVLATEVVNKSINRIGIILLLFVIITGILVFLIFSDISKSNTYRAQLLEAKEEAERLSAVKQRFLANMSHEIRTPLQSIIGFSEQIRQEEHPKKESLDAIYHSSEHLLQIVNEVLDYSRIVSGKFIFVKETFSMQQLLDDVAATMEMQAIKKNIAFVYEPPATELLYNGDPFRLRQILYNLLGNAVKFTDKGKVSFSTDVNDFAEKTEFIFRISDTGIGMSEEEKKRVFNIFEQADSTVQRTFGGTGLGLSIVKSLVETQGGTIGLASTPGKGSEFTIRLTYQKARKAIAEKASGVPEISAIAFTGKVLVVDDDPLILQLCSGILDNHHIPHVCNLSSEAVLAQEWDDEINLVLTDVRMPVIDGIELSRQLRKRIPADVKIFALTAQAFPEEKEHLRKQGFDGILMKPFKEQELLALIGVVAQSAETTDNKAIQTADTSFDLSSIIEMSMNDAELLKANLRVLIDETQKDLQEVQAHLQSGNNRQLMETAHKLAGKTALAGAPALAAAYRKVEKEMENGKADTELITALYDETGVLVEKVEDYLRQLN